MLDYEFINVRRGCISVGKGVGGERGEGEGGGRERVKGFGIHPTPIYQPQRTSTWNQTPKDATLSMIRPPQNPTTRNNP